VSSHSHERNSTDGRVLEPKPHDMGLQISCGLHSEMSAQGAVSGTAPTPGRGVPKACATEGIGGRGRASDGRPRPHAAIDPAETRVSRVVGYIKGKSAIHLARVYGEQAQLCGPALLGPWVLREYGRPGRRSHPSLHPQSTERRSEARTDELVAPTTPPFSGSKLTGRVSDPSYRFERFAS
jgi:hypothetical protein